MRGIVRGWVRRRAADPVLLAALGLGTLFHGALLAAGSYRRTYDAYVHIFFADHYSRGWFDTWEPRWYTGFTVTSYPPGTHQLMALMSKLVGLEAAFVVVQLTGVLLVIVGVYRLTLLIGSRRAAGLGALLTVVATGLGQAVHVFGQLPTVCALGLLLNSLPHVRRWVVGGSRRDLITSVGLLAGTTALHHVTTLFGAVFFLAPVIAHGLLERFRTPAAGESTVRPARVSRKTLAPLTARRVRRILRPALRSAALGVLMLGVLAIVVLPYWVWSRSDPILQIPIPHGSRENFLQNLNAGLVFWLVPWGLTLLAVPFAVWRGLRTSAWPFVASFGLLAILGTGGTTPIPRFLLGGAFEILTLDRFTFWATILVTPFAGMLAEELADGAVADRVSSVFGSLTLRLVRPILVIGLLAAVIFTVNLAALRRMQPDPIDTGPIVSFLERDQHWQWRYLTLGFGDQMAWLSAQTTAQTVDGNYHSARRLPELITAPIERLEGAKFRGLPGLGSLQQFLAVPEKYHLKFVFSNDQFYDPLLLFSGWREIGRLENGVVVWEREDVPPMPAVVSRPELPVPYRAMWGVLPMSALVFAGVSAFAGAGARVPRRSGTDRRTPLAALEAKLEEWARVPDGGDSETSSWTSPARRFAERLRPSDRVLRTLGIAAVLMCTAGGGLVAAGLGTRSPGDVVVAYFDALDVRRLEDSWQHLDPATRPTVSEYLVRLSLEDGLLASYASLDRIEIIDETVEIGRANVEVALTYVTALAEYRSVREVSLRRASGRWWIEPTAELGDEPVERLARRAWVAFEPMGRRTATAGTTEYDDILDRPELEVSAARLVLLDGHPVVIGSVRNRDADPAALTVTAQLIGSQGETLAAYNAAQMMAHSLLPGESTAFRVDFEGVAGVGDVGTFYPEDFVPLGPTPLAEGIDVYAAAVVTGRGLERPVAVRDLVVGVDESGAPELRGSILNLGVEDATVVALLVSLYDTDGALIWVDRVVVPRAVRPGLSEPFTTSLTEKSRLEPVEVTGRSFGNGRRQHTVTTAPVGLIPLPAETGYSGLEVQPVTFARSTA